MTINVYALSNEISPVNINASRSESTMDDISRNLPQGLYTTFRTYDGSKKVLGLKHHLERIYTPCLQNDILPSISHERFRLHLNELLREYQSCETRIRVCLSLTEHIGQVYVMIEKFTLPDEIIYQSGVSLISSHAERVNPRLKSTVFIQTSEHERKTLLNSDVYEILRIRENGILEGYTSNFYALKNSEIITARKGILLGVTRRVILRLIRVMGLPLIYRPLDLEEIPEIDEAFISSSSRGVVPVISIDKKPVGQGSVGSFSRELRIKYEDYVKKNAERI